MLKRIVRIAAPIMFSYAAVGLACGVLAAQAGMAPWMTALVSLTYFSGSGQFMISNLWLAGTPTLSIAASVSAISARFALYSASFAPYLKDASSAQTLGVAGTLIEEGYGISMGKIVEGDGWGPRESTLLNVVLILTWTVFTVAGTLVGAAIEVPTAVAAFACTSLFIYLLSAQEPHRGNVVAAAVAFATVAALKLAGLAGIAVPVAAVAGVAAALALDAFPRKGGERHADR